MSTLSLSPDEGESEEEPCKEAAEDVEHHVGGEAGHCQVLHCVEPKKADPNEEKPTVDLMVISDDDEEEEDIDDNLFKCETVSRIKAETEKNDEEEEAETENLE